MKDLIFISYSHKDMSTVNKIAAVIQKESNMPVWIDRSLRGGEDFWNAIATKILESSYFVFIVSANSVVSDWCLRELKYAASKNKPIISVWLGDISIPPEVELIINDKHYINYFTISDDVFSERIGAVFKGGELSSSAKFDDSYEHSIEQSNEFFLEKDKRKKLTSLLMSEKQGKYTVCFEPENAYLLGIAYEYGYDVDIDLKKAEMYYKTSAHFGNYEGKYLYAALKQKKNESEDSSFYLKEATEAAEHGSVYALTFLGDDYYNGKNGCEKNLEKTYEYYNKAALKGGAQAMYYLSYGYRTGDGINKDPELAYMYAMKSVELGFPRAYRTLAFMYRDGIYFEKDYDKAIKMFDEAIKHGDYLSYIYKGFYVYYKLNDLLKELESYKKAAELAEKGKIKSGLPFFRMGYAYEYGEGVSQNHIKAAEYYLKGAERKHQDSLKYAVFTIMNIEDKNIKLDFLKKALDLGCENAAYWLGFFEKEKSKDKKLTDKAIKYFTIGAGNGNLYCVEELIGLYSWVIGEGKSKDERQNAIKWLKFFFEYKNNIWEKLLDQEEKSKYCFLYAMELDYDPFENSPDKELAKQYYKMSLEKSATFLKIIINFSIDAYLLPDKSGSGLIIDVAHTEELLELTEPYIEKYYQYLCTDKKDEKEENWSELMELLHKGYTKLSSCYHSGEGVKKDRKKARKYKQKAERIKAGTKYNFAEN